MRGNEQGKNPGQGRDYFTRRMFRRQYLPALISAITLSASDMADSVVVGNSNLGLLGLAAMSFALPIFMVYNVIMHSFGLGGSIRYAGQMARGEEEEASAGFRGVVYTLVLTGVGIALLGNMLLTPLQWLLGVNMNSKELVAATGTYLRLLLCSAPLFFLSYSLGYYMRNADMEKAASICASVGNIVDVGLNALLVLVFRLGVLGAGIGTLCGPLITSLLELIILYRRKTTLRVFGGKADFSRVLRSFRMGFSSSVSYAYALVHIVICNNLLMRISGEQGVAVFDVIQNISYFFSYIYGAAGQAAQPILSTYGGEYNQEGSRVLQKMGLRVALQVGILPAALMSIFAPQVCRFFGLIYPAAVNLGSWAIRMFCLSTMLGGIHSLLAGYRLARGEEFPAFISTTLRGAVVLIPVTILFSFFGERRFWLLYPVTECIALLLFLLFLRRRGDRHSIDPERIYRAELRDRVEDVGRVTEEIGEFCEKWEASIKQQYFVRMTVEEVCSAIIVNGFGKGKDENGIIQVTLVAGEDGIFTLHVRDSAVAFNPFGMEKADLKNDGDALDFNAVGMDVIKKRSREFYYRRYQGFNTMVVKV